MAVAIHNKSAEITERYRRLFDIKEQQLNGQKNHALHSIRREAIEQLESVGFPARKDEDYKYTYVTKIAQQEWVEGKGAVVGENVINNCAFCALNAYHLVFVNGVFYKSLSRIEGLAEGLSIQSLKEAYEEEANQTFIKDTLSSQLGSNAFVLLNTAFAQNGIFIKVAKNTVIEKPIHINNITVSGGPGIFTNPQIIVSAERNSEIQIIETYNAVNDGTYFTNAVSRFALEKNARVHHYKLQNESINAFQINNTIVTQDRDSTYSSYALDLGSKTVRNNLSSSLKDSGITTNLFGVYLAKGNQHIDNQTFIDHAFPHCDSNELYKGIIDDKGRGVFNGKVNVRPDAQKTNAFQQNSSLVLSDTAVMDTKPQLEIFADDVKCSHGATIGQLDENSLFYLRTRGMSLEQAKSMLQFAFVAEVLDNFKLDAVKEKALKLLDEKLESGTR
jgi:Fe-S cluster assembly protein SufD